MSCFPLSYVDYSAVLAFAHLTMFRMPVGQRCLKLQFKLLLSQFFSLPAVSATSFSMIFVCDSSRNNCGKSNNAHLKYVRSSSLWLNMRLHGWGKNNTTKENLPKNKLLFMDTLQVTFGSLWKLTQLEIQVEVNIFVAFVYEGVIIYTDK